MTEFKVGDRVLRVGDPATIAGVRGDGNEAWWFAVEGEEYLVYLDSGPTDVYYARPEDLERI